MLPAAGLVGIGLAAKCAASCLVVAMSDCVCVALGIAASLRLPHRLAWALAGIIASACACQIALSLRRTGPVPSAGSRRRPAPCDCACASAEAWRSLARRYFVHLLDGDGARIFGGLHCLAGDCDQRLSVDVLAGGIFVGIVHQLDRVLIAVAGVLLGSFGLSDAQRIARFKEFQRQLGIQNHGIELVAGGNVAAALHQFVFRVQRSRWFPWCPRE